MFDCWAIIYVCATPALLMSIHQPTVDNYTNRTAAFQAWALDQAYQAAYARTVFINSLGKNRSLQILDVGCGSGRDADYFSNLGIVDRVVAIDPVDEFCKQTKLLIGDENVFCTDVLGYKSQKKFDGIYTMASLFHIKRNNLSLTLEKLYSLLSENGILLSTFLSGGANINTQGIDGRWVNKMPLDMQKDYLIKAGFAIEFKFQVSIYNGEWDAIIARRA